MEDLIEQVEEILADPVTLGAAAGVIVLIAALFFLVHRNRSMAAKKLAVQKIKSRKNEAGQWSAQESAAPEVEAQTAGVRTSEVIEVSEVDPLEGVDIYIEYGYYERAAETLRWYVDSSAGHSDLNALRKLLQVYFQLSQIDNYALVLEKLSEAGERADFLKRAFVAGLKEDSGNLQLRVFAEACLGISFEKINSILGGVPEAPKPAPPVEPAKPAAPDPEEVRPVPAREEIRESAEKPAAPPAERRAAPRLGKQVVEGTAPLDPLSSQERDVIDTLVPAALAAKLYLSFQNYECAIPVLKRAIVEQPKALVNFTEILKLYYFRKEVDEYAKTLWQLFNVLDNYGSDLKERLLGVGFSMGTHPVLEALAQAKERRHLEAIGRNFGYYPVEMVTSKGLDLVSASVSNETYETGHDGDAVLAEVDSYIEYGQIDEALELLEREILADPQKVQLYRPLLDLYDRMDALARFTSMASEIKKRAQRPTAEVISMMNSLYKRLQLRTQQIAA